jgi:hypothetical protein
MASRYLNYRHTQRRPRRTPVQPRTSSPPQFVTPCPEGGGATSEPPGVDTRRQLHRSAGLVPIPWLDGWRRRNRPTRIIYRPSRLRLCLSGRVVAQGVGWFIRTPPLLNLMRLKNLHRLNSSRLLVLPPTLAQNNPTTIWAFVQRESVDSPGGHGSLGGLGSLCPTAVLFTLFVSLGS